MELTTAKVVCILVQFTTSMIFGCLPYFIVKGGNSSPQHEKARNSVISFMKCFSGGVFMAACLLNLLPSGIGAMDTYFHMVGITTEYPVYMAITALGFFIIAFVEQLAHSLIHRYHHSNTIPEAAQLNNSPANTKANEAPLHRNSNEPTQHRNSYEPSQHCNSNENPPSCNSNENPPHRNRNENPPHCSSIGPTLYHNSNEAYPHRSSNEALYRNGKENTSPVLQRSKGDTKSLDIQEMQAFSSGDVRGCSVSREASRVSEAATICLDPKSVVNKPVPNGNTNFHKNETPEGHDEVNDIITVITGNPLRAFLLLAALSFHTIFDGLAVGLETTQDDMWQMFTAIVIHKALVSTCLGLQLFMVYKDRPLVGCMWTLQFAAIAPIGIGIGIFLTSGDIDEVAKQLANSFLQGIATGTFLYVTFFEILKEEIVDKRGFLRILLVALGFSVMGVLKYLLEQV